MRKTRSFISILALITIITTGCQGRGGDEDEALILRRDVITRGNLQETISLTGTVNASLRADLPFLQSGTLVGQFVHEGERARTGDILLQLDSSAQELEIRDAELAVQLQQLALAELRAGPSQYDLAAARAAVARAQAQLNQISSPPSEEAMQIAQANLDIARSNYWVSLVERDTTAQIDAADQSLDSAELNISANELSMNIALQELMNIQQGTSEGDINVARASVYQAQTSLNRLLAGVSEYDIKIAEVQINLAELALERARKSLENGMIIAPFNGIVARVIPRIGERVTPGIPVITILNDSNFLIDVFVDELDIPRIRVGQIAFIQLDAFPEAQFTAHVERIAPDSQDVLGISSYQVRLRIDPTEFQVKDGMTALVEIVTTELTDVVIVPNWAIRFDRSTGVAYVLTRASSGEVTEIPVEVGVRGEEFTEILSGILPGEEVLLLQEDSLDVFGSP